MPDLPFCGFLYGLGTAVGSELACHTVDDFRDCFLSGDVVLRLAALLLSDYYIVNIFRLPIAGARWSIRATC
ncbi:MAG: hypothetical protein ACLS29_09690 [Prevotellamassilia sp.]